MITKGIDVDVICQHKVDGSIIPLRIRIADEEGQFHIFRIHSYKDVTTFDRYTMPNAVAIKRHIWQFECKIAVLNTEKVIRLSYNAYDNRWNMSY